MYIYINNQIVRHDQAHISVFDHGFMYGLGLFETFRVYNGHPFLLDDHLQRLNEGLKQLDIDVQFNREGVLSILHSLLSANGWQDAYIRFNVSAGIGELGLSTSTYEKPSIIMYAKSLHGVSFSSKKVVSLKINRNTPEGPIRLKSHHYMNNILAKKEIGNDSSIEGLFYTAEGYVAEGVVSNVFWVKENTLFTPDIGTGILNGVTRQFVKSIANKLGLPIIEGYFTKKDVLEADEMFLTNSIQEILPVISYDACEFKLCDESITVAIQNEYTQGIQSMFSRKDIES
ncbi:4-amino-4-deoxychorismate lyase [Bacillus sp. HMF5848]|uniref:aminodeoxychorismate lyase n=1 Tax=Bacillus sp. HMF5848 TaxID=2495421 RepID=UPI000F7B16D0|nr:aminodeoxychorismate lyase [Bacillus sp. HMF5848]RSK25510.1 4-amino-4-deoxychorismate lyase [Bacillus sp. HMF5848]